MWNSLYIFHHHIISIYTQIDQAVATIFLITTWGIFYFNPEILNSQYAATDFYQIFLYRLWIPTFKIFYFKKVPFTSLYDLYKIISIQTYFIYSTLFRIPTVWTFFIKGNPIYVFVLCKIISIQTSDLIHIFCILCKNRDCKIIA